MQKLHDRYMNRTGHEFGHLKPELVKIKQVRNLN